MKFTVTLQVLADHVDGPKCSKAAVRKTVLDQILVGLDGDVLTVPNEQGPAEYIISSYEVSS